MTSAKRSIKVINEEAKTNELNNFDFNCDFKIWIKRFFRGTENCTESFICITLV